MIQAIMPGARVVRLQTSLPDRAGELMQDYW